VGIAVILVPGHDEKNKRRPVQWRWRMIYEVVDDYKLKPQKIAKDYEEYWLVKGDINGHVQIIRRGQLMFLAYDYYHNDCHKNPLYKIVKVGMTLDHVCTDDEIREAHNELNNW
jgi:hypothetical protein